MYISNSLNFLICYTKKYMKSRIFLLTISFLAVFNSGVLCGQHDDRLVIKHIDNYARTLSSQPDSAFYYIRMATAESEKNNDPFLLSRCYYNLGYYYYLQKQLEKSKAYTCKSFPYAGKARNYTITALGYNQLGLIDRDQGNYSSALQDFLKSLDIAEKHGLMRNQSVALNNLGYLYDLQNDTVKALKAYTESQQIAYGNNLKFELLATYNNIAILEKKRNAKKAIDNYKKAYAIAVALNDKYEQFNILINLSDSYAATVAGRQTGFRYLMQAKKIAEELKDQNLLFYLYFNLGGYYRTLKTYDEAIKNYHTALQFSEKGISQDQKWSLLQAIEQVYSESGNFKQAYFYKEACNRLKDSVFTIEKNKAFHEIQTKYEVDKKNLRIQLLTKEKIIQQNRKELILIVGLILVVALLIALWVYKNRIRIQKIINEKESEIHKKEIVRLEQEKELKRITGVVQGQDQERNRIAKEIHDGIGGTLAGVKLQLSQANTIMKNKGIDIIIEQMTLVCRNLRSISHNLSLNYLKDKDLEVLLNELKEEYQYREEFQIEAVVYPEGALNSFSESVKHQAYRIVQELVANISKHAAATDVMLNVTRHNDLLNIIVEDNGRGFDNTISKGIGLKNVEERLSAINGSMIIESQLGRGTTVIIDIPI